MSGSGSVGQQPTEQRRRTNGHSLPRSLLSSMTRIEYLRGVGKEAHGELPLLHEEHVGVVGHLGNLLPKVLQLLLTDLPRRF
jgi:hypothetical protein